MKRAHFFILVASFTIFMFQACSDNSSGPKKNDPNQKDTTYMDVTYGIQDRHKVDLYLSKNRNENTPTIVFIHGGAWKAGNKEDFNGAIKKFLKEWPEATVVNMNYRLASTSSKIHHQEIMSDIASCLDFLVKEKQIYHIGSTFFLVGASAGGHLAMIYSFKENSKHNIKAVGNIFGPSILNDWTWYNSFNVVLGEKISDVLINYIGASWDSTVYANVSPYSQIDSSTTPTISFHGNLDPVVPVYQSKWMHNRLKQYAIKNEYHEYVAFHGFDQTQENEVIKKMVTFFKQTL